MAVTPGGATGSIDVQIVGINTNGDLAIMVNGQRYVVTPDLMVIVEGGEQVPLSQALEGRLNIVSLDPDDDGTPGTQPSTNTPGSTTTVEPEQPSASPPGGGTTGSATAPSAGPSADTSGDEVGTRDDDGLNQIPEGALLWDI